MDLHLRIIIVGQHLKPVSDRAHGADDVVAHPAAQERRELQRRNLFHIVHPPPQSAQILLPDSIAPPRKPASSPALQDHTPP